MLRLRATRHHRRQNQRPRPRKLLPPGTQSLQRAARPLKQGASLKPQRRASTTVLRPGFPGPKTSASHKSTESDPPKGTPSSAECVQGSVGSRNSAIHNAYRTSLRPSSMHKPRHPSLKVVRRFQVKERAGAHRGKNKSASELEKPPGAGAHPHAMTGVPEHHVPKRPRRAQ